MVDLLDVVVVLQVVHQGDDPCRDLRIALHEIGGDHRDLGRVLMLKGDPEAALEEFRINESPEGIVVALHDLGRQEEFEAAFDELRKNETDEFPDFVAYVYAWIGDIDKAFEYLDKAYEVDRTSLSRIVRYPVYRSLHSDPRWQALLQKLGMSDEQLAAIDFELPPRLIETLERQ